MNTGIDEPATVSGDVKVAIVTTSFGSSGGVATVASFLYHRLSASERYLPELISVPMPAGTEVNVRMSHPDSWFSGIQVKKKRDGIPYREIGAFLAEFEFQRYRPRPALTKKLEKYDLVQVVAGAPNWAYLTKNISAPVALQVATLIETEREGKYQEEAFPLRLWRHGMTKIAAWMERQVPSMVDAIFVENQWMYEHYRQNHPDANVHFAPPGVDTSTYHPAEETNDDAYILSVGRFSDPRKNVELLFEAYHRLRQRRPNAPRLVLAGLAGPRESAWATAKSLGITDHIDVHVEVPEEKLVRLYRNASLFVLSSKEEGLGLVIAEAMASGIPVVSTDCGGPSTLVEEGETGYLTPVGNPEALAERMEKILRDPEHARALGRRGRERIESHFSEEAAGEKFLSVYNHLLA